MENQNCRPFMDVAGFARQFICGENADDDNWITGIEEMGFPLRLEPLHIPKNVAGYCFFAKSGAISKAIHAIINHSAIVPFHSLEKRQLSFYC